MFVHGVGDSIMLISIVIPVYNAEKFITKCLDSLINQTYNDLEIIAINDGSNDSTPNILDEFAVTDKRINVVHKKNTGVSDSRNIGIKMCTGEYIAFVDADDWIENDYIEKAVDVLKDNYPCMLLNGMVEECDGKLICSPEHEFIIFDNKELFFEQLFLFKYINWGPFATFYSSKCIKHVKFSTDIRFGEDLHFKYSFAKASDGIIMYAPIVKYHYVRNSTSATKSYSIIKMYDDIKVMRWIIDNEQNHLGNLMYYRNYVRRLLFYAFMGALCNNTEEKKLSDSCKYELINNWWKIFKSKYTSRNTRIKMILLFLPKVVHKFIAMKLK